MVNSYSFVVHLMGLIPVRSCGGVGHKGHTKRVCLFHLVLEQGSYFVGSILPDFQYQFVVNLQYHSGRKAACNKGPVHPDHGQFDDVSRAPLNRSIYRDPLRSLLSDLVRSFEGRGEGACAPGTVET